MINKTFKLKDSLYIKPIISRSDSENINNAIKLNFDTVEWTQYKPSLGETINFCKLENLEFGQISFCM